VEGTRWLRLLHPSVLAVSIGVFAASVGFDLGSIVAADQFVYARGAATLIAFGLGAGLLAVVLVVLELASWGPAPGRREGLQHLFGFDAVLIWFVISFLIRQPEAIDPVSVAYIGLSGLVVLAAVVMHVRYLRLLASGAGTQAASGAEVGTGAGSDRPAPADEHLSATTASA